MMKQALGFIERANPDRIGTSRGISGPEVQAFSMKAFFG